VRTLRTNLIAEAKVTFCVARQMMQQGGGRIVNVSSRGAFRGEPEISCLPGSAVILVLFLACHP
jgi:short-subunit dehydrogenase